MALEYPGGGAVQAVVAYDGQLLLVRQQGDGWGLPTGTPEPAESVEATAERLVYELTGYLVDGSQSLDPPAEPAAEAPAAVVCQLLTEDPSGGARLTAEQIRWFLFEDAARTSGLPQAVRDYLEGHTPA
ncbi:NUDIX hydrolase [Streptomyces sp. V3I7]|uniref:NUDIX hydrolase n=1 Tax=Streptomyces sp. V3I7 TaxID=3042278 RepID=UPI00278ACD3A|nr:NUDIX hydrolase [Streptomyces sp. V3I7]MDQ0994623.1 8-oxo-dGTP diphosphatase [Streptomyces sp. V3I7]